MDATHEARLEQLLRLPWTIVTETTPEGDRLLRVAEVPGAVGTGETEAQRVADLWEALRTALLAYMHFGDPVPVPRGAREGWLAGRPGPRAAYVVRKGAPAEPSQATASAVEAVFS